MFAGPPASVIEFALKKKFHLITSSVILKELERNLVAKFDVSPRSAKKVIFRIIQVADVYEPKGTIRVIPNRHTDNLILETALLGKARYLVTGDRKHLLPFKHFKNIRIIEPAHLLKILER